MKQLEKWKNIFFPPFSTVPNSQFPPESEAGPLDEHDSKHDAAVPLRFALSRLTLSLA